MTIYTVQISVNIYISTLTTVQHTLSGHSDESGYNAQLYLNVGQNNLSSSNVTVLQPTHRKRRCENDAVDDELATSLQSPEQEVGLCNKFLIVGLNNVFGKIHLDVYK